MKLAHWCPLNHNLVETQGAPALGRFTSPDSLVPEPGNPQAFDRYSYVQNNPVRYNDPSGHISCTKLGAEVCNEKGNFADEEPPPVVQYIYNEMVNNAQSDMTTMIWLLNNMPFMAGGFAKLDAYFLWGIMVRSGGPWDHKDIIQEMEFIAGRDPDYQRVGGREYRFDTWSNIHYGYVGMAAGFSPEELLNGAGLEQIGSDLLDVRAPIATPGVTGLKKFDDPYDQVGIQLGIRLWLDYRLDLKIEHILQALANTPGLYIRPH